MKCDSSTELRRHRPLCAHADAEGGGDHELEDVQGPDARMAERCVRREPEAAGDHPHLLQEHHATAVEGIGERPADHGQRQQRDEVRERDEADGERRAGQLVHLVREGTSAISVPMNEMPCPNQSRLKAGLRRSGVTSSANRAAR